MATYAAKTNRLEWQQLIQQNKVILLDYRYDLDPDQRQFDMVWHFKGFMDAIKERGMAGRDREVLLIIDEISAMLGQRTQDGRSILAEDLQELVAVYGRGYGVNTVIAHQSLFQLDERIQDILMGMGNQIIGQLSAPADAARVAQQFMRYDPCKVKKIENVWHSIHPPAILSFFGGPEYPYPKVIDQRTVEFTPEEQMLAWVNKILDLDRFQFLTQIATGEGGKKAPAQKISIANLDKHQYPQEAILAPLRQALTRRDGLPLDKLCTEIQTNRLAIMLEKTPKQPKKEPATMKGNHDPHNSPTTPVGNSPSTGHRHPNERTANGANDPDFWEPQATTPTDLARQ
jgi:hypothetical protein